MEELIIRPTTPADAEALLSIYHLISSRLLRHDQGTNIVIGTLCNIANIFNQLHELLVLPRIGSLV